MFTILRNVSLALVILTVWNTNAHSQTAFESLFQNLLGMQKSLDQTNKTTPKAPTLQQQKGDPYYFQRALGFALTIGNKTRWKNPETGNYGSITPIAPYTGTGGKSCWKYSRTFVHKSRTTDFDGVACQETGGQWIIAKETITGQGTAVAQGTAIEKQPDESLRQVQAQLAEMGYDPGPADGLSGPRTRRAIEAYQRGAGLRVNGREAPSRLLVQMASAPESRSLSALGDGSGGVPSVPVSVIPERTPDDLKSTDPYVGDLVGEKLPSQTVADTAVYVEFRESDLPGAPVVDRWRLYGASHALVIGIDNYTDGWPRLSNAIKDAKLVAEGLRDQGFEVELLTDLTGVQLREALRRFFAFRGKDPEARLFVWFAGHGHTENGEGYLVPADAPLPGNPEFNYVALHMGDVGSMVRIAQSKHVLAVFDACFAGTIFSSQRSRPPAAITAAVKRPARQFLTSGDADQKVSDDGTFRTLFLRALKGEETADANRDGYLTGTELSFYLENRITNLTQGSQTPRGGKLRDPKYDQGDFVFLLPKAPAAPLAETAPGTAMPEPDGSGPGAFELTFWKSVENSADPADFEDYLAQFPDGMFSSLARRRLASLTKPTGLVPTAVTPIVESDVSRLTATP